MLSENPLRSEQKKGTQYKRLKVSWRGVVKCRRNQGRRVCCQNEIKFEKDLLGRAKWKSW